MRLPNLPQCPWSSWNCTSQSRSLRSMSIRGNIPKCSLLTVFSACSSSSWTNEPGAVFWIILLARLIHSTNSQYHFVVSRSRRRVEFNKRFSVGGSRKWLWGWGTCRDSCSWKPSTGISSWWSWGWFASSRNCSVMIKGKVSFPHKLQSLVCPIQYVFWSNVYCHLSVCWGSVI